MHYPTTDPGPAVGKLTGKTESITVPFRKGTVRAFYRLVLRENCCGTWDEPEVLYAEWTFCPGSDVELSEADKYELKQLIEDRI